MNLGFEQIASIAIIIAGGALLQGTVGFGMALFALPLIIWTGVPLQVAMAIMVAASSVQLASGCWRLREHLDWKPALGVCACRLAVLPLGWLTLFYVADLGQSRVKQVVGATLLLLVALRLMVRVQPREKVRWWWAALAGGSSGYLSGLVGMSGPPIVLWVTAHNWSSQKTRVMVWSCVLPLIPINIAGLAWKFGWPVMYGAAIGLAMAPLTVGANMVGIHLGGRMSGPRLRTMALVVLVLIALASVIQPLLAMSGG